MGNPLQKLAKLGQSFWLDNLSRDLISSGELKRLIDEDGLRGITSNPTIFEKALASTDEYDEEMDSLLSSGQSNDEIFESLAVRDIQMAADLLRPVYDASNGEDGFVSLELPPALALDTERSAAEGKRLFERLNRPNVMIKVPGTTEGIPAFEQLIADGVNVNVTLLFSLNNYARVAEAYIRGIEQRAANGQPVDSVASVASFFVSRVDSKIDKQIDDRFASMSDDAEKERLASLKGTVAVANAKIAYQRFQAIFSDERFKRLQAEHGARVQRPLWASTSTKNPDYSDVLYIETLIGPDTVQTMAPVSVDAFRDHGKVERTIDQGVDEAQRTLDELASVGIDYDKVTRELQVEGVKAFADSFDTLIDRIGAKRSALVGSGGESR